MERALPCLETALSLKPNEPEYHLEIGNVHSERGQFHDALASYNRAIALKPDYAEAYVNRGIALKALNRLDEALTSYNRATSLRPGYAEAYSNRGNALKELGRLDEAVASYDKAISLRKDYAEAYSSRGNALKELDRLDEALASYDKAISLRPDYAEAYSSRGNALKDLRRLDEALGSYNKAISLKPDYAEAFSNRGNALKELHRFDEALASYDKAINLKPDYAEAQYNKSVLLLSLKEFREGFELYHKWRWDTKKFGGRPLVATPHNWNGEPSTRRLLLLAEQGIGDEVFYSSMITLMNSDTMVTLSADRRLHPIYERSFPGINLIDRVAKNPSLNNEFDAQAYIGDLGCLLNVSSEVITRRRYPFLLASSQRKQELIAKNEFLRRKPVCGISWKSSNKQFGDEKSVPLIALSPILQLKDITFVNLQYGDVNADLIGVAEAIGTTVHQVANLDAFNDIDSLLALIDACDVVVTTSSVTAHLAGAIGKSAAVLVPAGKGRLWYWHDEPQSTWYPSLRLFGQGDNWDWSDAISEAANWIKESL